MVQHRTEKPAPASRRRRETKATKARALRGFSYTHQRRMLDGAIGSRAASLASPCMNAFSSLLSRWQPLPPWRLMSSCSFISSFIWRTGRSTQRGRRASHARAVSSAFFFSERLERASARSRSQHAIHQPTTARSKSQKGASSWQRGIPSSRPVSQVLCSPLCAHNLSRFDPHRPGQIQCKLAHAVEDAPRFLDARPVPSVDLSLGRREKKNTKEGRREGTCASSSAASPPY